MRHIFLSIILLFSIAGIFATSPQNETSRHLSVSDFNGESLHRLDFKLDSLSRKYFGEQIITPMAERWGLLLFPDVDTVLSDGCDTVIFFAASRMTNIYPYSWLLKTPRQKFMFQTPEHGTCINTYTCELYDIDKTPVVPMLDKWDINAITKSYIEVPVDEKKVKGESRCFAARIICENKIIKEIEIISFDNGRVAREQIKKFRVPRVRGEGRLIKKPLLR